MEKSFLAEGGNVVATHINWKLVLSKSSIISEVVKGQVEFLVASDFPGNGLLPVFVERKLAHEAWYPHAAVHLWLIDDASRVVLQRRSENKDNNPGCWDIAVAGHVGILVESLEELEEKVTSVELSWGDDSLKRKTVYREAFEELGIERSQLKKLKKLKDITFADKSLQNGKEFRNAQTNWIFIGRLKKPLNELRLQSEEVSEVSSFGITELEDAVIAFMKGEEPKFKLVRRHPGYYAPVFAGIRKMLGLPPNGAFDAMLEKTDSMSMDFEPLTPSANFSETGS